MYNSYNTLPGIGVGVTAPGARSAQNLPALPLLVSDSDVKERVGVMFPNNGSGA